jgi:hypothetical protein
MYPEVMTDLAILLHKGTMILLRVSTGQVIHLPKGVMIHMEAVTGQVIRHLLLPVVVHPPVVVHLLVAAVTVLQEAAPVPAITLPLHEEEVNNMSNNISLIRLQNGHRHSAAFKNIDL